VSATNLLGRQLREQGRGAIAPVVVPLSRLVLQSAHAGAQPTLRALDHSTPSGAFVGPTRFGQVRGAPELLAVYSTASDPAVAAHVWDLTTQVLGSSVPV
jgi:hypothetical protein